MLWWSRCSTSSCSISVGLIWALEPSGGELKLLHHCLAAQPKGTGVIKRWMNSFPHLPSSLMNHTNPKMFLGTKSGNVIFRIVLFCLFVLAIRQTLNMHTLAVSFDGPHATSRSKTQRWDDILIGTITWNYAIVMKLSIAVTTKDDGPCMEICVR